MTPLPPDDEHTEIDLLLCLVEDRERGALRPLVDYLARFQLDDRIVARRFLEVADDLEEEDSIPTDSD